MLSNHISSMSLTQPSAEACPFPNLRLQDGHWSNSRCCHHAGAAFKFCKPASGPCRLGLMPAADPVPVDPLSPGPSIADSSRINRECLGLLRTDQAALIIAVDPKHIKTIQALPPAACTSSLGCSGAPASSLGGVAGTPCRLRRPNG